MFRNTLLTLLLIAQGTSYKPGQIITIVNELPPIPCIDGALIIVKKDSTVPSAIYFCTQTNWHDIVHTPFINSPHHDLPAKVILQNDVINNGPPDVYKDCTNLKFPVLANVLIEFRFKIFYTAAANSTGSAWSINGPAFSHLAYKSNWGTLSAETVNFFSTYNQPNNANPASPGGVLGNIAFIDGFILPITNGEVILRFSTEINNSAITCKAGSNVIWMY